MPDLASTGAGSPAELHQAQRLRAAAALRTFIERLVGTEASLAELDAAARACEALRELLPPASRTSRYQPCLPEGAKASYDIPFDTDVVIGALNPLAAPYKLEQRERPVTLSARFSLAYEGVPGQVHGAHLMAGCDWAMGVAAASVANGVVTGTMSTRFVAPCPPGRIDPSRSHARAHRRSKVVHQGCGHRRWGDLRDRGGRLHRAPRSSTGRRFGHGPGGMNGRGARNGRLT